MTRITSESKQSVIRCQAFEACYRRPPSQYRRVALMNARDYTVNTWGPASRDTFQSSLFRKRTIAACLEKDNQKIRVAIFAL